MLLQGPPPPLTWQQLHEASKMAVWSGLCYVAQDQLSSCLASEGQTLLASGRTPFTSWYIAEGAIDEQPLLQKACRYSSPQPPQATSASSDYASSRQLQGGRLLADFTAADLAGGRAVRSATDSNGSSSAASTSLSSSAGSSGASFSGSNGALGSPNSGAAAEPAGRGSSAMQQPSSATASEAGEQRVVVILRGVHWSAPDIDARQLWTSLMNAWPAPFAAGHTYPEGSLLAHPGVAKIVEALYSDIAPHLQGLLQQGRRITFAGHSLGGSLGLLLLALVILRGGAQPERKRAGLKGLKCRKVLSHQQLQCMSECLQLACLSRAWCHSCFSYWCFGLRCFGFVSQQQAIYFPSHFYNDQAPNTKEAGY